MSPPWSPPALPDDPTAISARLSPEGAVPGSDFAAQSNGLGESPPESMRVARRIAVIGASGRLGAAVYRGLLAQGDAPWPVVRSAAAWEGLGLGGQARIADLRRPEVGGDLARSATGAAQGRAGFGNTGMGNTGAGAAVVGMGLAAALRGAEVVITCAQARFAAAVIAAAPPGARLIFMGTTRRFSVFPDELAEAVRRGEEAFLASGRPGVMLHPTMVYGALAEDNVPRLAALLRRLPLAPLPGGGHNLVQPIHQSDVVRCILAAVAHSWTGPESLVIAGPKPVSYRAFLREVCRAAGFRPRAVLPLPLPLLRLALPLLWLLPGLPRLRMAELQRLTEDRAYRIDAMREVLGVEPIALEEGLAQTFARPDSSA